MDTQIEHKKRFTPKQIYGGVGVVLLIVLILYLFFRDTSSSMTVEKNRITIATIKEGEFNDYIRVIGQVLPSRMIYLDAIEGGRVEERLFEEGAMVKKGDAILRLSNPLLNIGIMQSEADLAQKTSEQIHFTRWQFDAAFLLQELKNLHCQHPFSFRLIIGATKILVIQLFLKRLLLKFTITFRL